MSSKEETIQLSIDCNPQKEGYGYEAIDRDPLSKLTPITFLSWNERNPSRRPNPNKRIFIPNFPNRSSRTASVTTDIIDVLLKQEERNNKPRRIIPSRFDKK